MSNFTVNFSNPWLLLLLIPALGLTLFSYFRLAKRYRCTRNRIVSIVLHLVVMLLCITTLAGISFSYDKPNTENEVLLLVDVSDSSDNSQQEKNEFIKTVIDECGSTVKVGVVTFGFEPVYAAPLTHDTDKVYQQYLNAKLPDDTATDIASALLYAVDLFKNPETAKIVLITDGVETDGNAMSEIKRIAAKGIKVDTVFFPTETGVEAQLVDITVPDYNIAIGDVFSLGYTVQSSIVGPATVTLYDNDEEIKSETIDLNEGILPYELTHSFALPGMHQLRLEISSDQDTIEENNSYYSYIYLEVFDKILIVTRTDTDSNNLKDLLVENEYDVNVVNVQDLNSMPKSVDEIRQYDQVILVNIANADMPIGFDEILYTYVHEIGGGLLTVGGNKIDEYGNEVANAYNRDDMVGTLYQQMLPVQAVNYTPPLGVMIIIDRSGSMGDIDLSTGKTKLDLAKDGAIACLNALDSWDWCGVMTLETYYSEDLELTPMPQASKIISAIDNIEMGGGTVYSGALERAGSALKALGAVERKHVILISDAMPSDSYDQYSQKIKHYNENAGVTFSFVTIGGNAGKDLENAAKLGGGRYYPVWNTSTLPKIMREDLTVDEIQDVNYKEFTPTIKDHTAVVNGIEQGDMPTLTGFYGTKVKDGVDVPLSGEFVPIYAQWKFGEGTVGSFMCDLNGTWSADFITNSTGQRLLNNIVGALFPTQNIRAKEIDALLIEGNYTTEISIDTEMKEENTISVTVRSPSADGGEDVVQTLPTANKDNYSRMKFTVKQPGIHEIVIEKMAKNENGQTETVAKQVLYKTFSYSKEYLAFTDAKESEAFLNNLATNGNGTLITESDEVFEDFLKTLHKTYDPRIVFITAAIVLFLLDIAVRKFKFKWLHEIIRERKNKQLSNEK
ncbi:MAG: VWA domain-containing protein [Clostridia bacterium]|nr:VWA domain-containing protein [Clostridia bacterium]